MRRDSTRKPIAQVISISSFADIKLKEDKQTEILEWANKLNGQPVPMRVYVAGTKLGVGHNLLNSTLALLAENAVTDSFTRVYRAWESLLADSRKREFIDS